VPKNLLKSSGTNCLKLLPLTALIKAHAACYGLIAYQTAYLKAHYPAAFMAALMTSDLRRHRPLSNEIAECKKMGVEVLQPPDVNESFHEFAVIPGEQ
jgi:DNA polymerase-3 subunit alpha